MAARALVDRRGLRLCYRGAVAGSSGILSGRATAERAWHGRGPQPGCASPWLLTRAKARMPEGVLERHGSPPTGYPAPSSPHRPRRITPVPVALAIVAGVVAIAFVWWSPREPDLRPSSQRS